MNRTLVSHECPVSILEESLVFNDYQYCLVHLLEEQEKYREWFTERYRALRPNGQILLDNSIFELGESFDSEKYVEWARIIKPNFYIVPDVLEDGYSTIHKYETFMTNFDNVPGKAIGVVQGSCWQEVVDCYKFMSTWADYIGISFDFSMYGVTGMGRTILEKCASGRQQLVQRLIDEGHWNWDKPHHLLGCSLAQEFKDYKFISSIRSVDTSNPIVAGLVGKRYYKGIGLLDKPKTLLADLINSPVDDELMRDILYNVDEFKNLL